MLELHAIARLVVLSLFCLSLLLALAGWLVRTRRVSPFGMSGRALRSLSGPILRPIENRVVRSGGDPTHAGWWLVIGVAAAGVLALSLLDWVTVLMAQVAGAAGSGPRALLGLAIVLAYNVVFFALLARVIGSWLGMFQYSRWMRPAYAITNWLVEPIRRILPPAGAFDFSPLAAWLALWVLKQLLLSVI